MTIKELIEKLESIDENAEVFVGDMAVEQVSVREVTGLFDFSDSSRKAIFLLGGANMGSSVFFQKEEREQE